ncbi:MAG: hypothetical protein IT423_23435 [Pirellulaceae bacterium]|nr:hypothetical protein [Pirellulaceae bacterium]
MSFIRKYWIVGLVILLVATHAVVIGYVRSEATRLKTVAASEIPVGLFYKQSADRQWLTQLRVHLQVPPESRLAARATIEHNRWVVHEAVEEALRGIDESLLQDPALVAVKEAIKLAIDEVLHEPIVEKVVINDRVDLDVREFRWRPSQDLITPGEEDQAAKSSTLTSVRPLRPALSAQHSGEHADGEHADGEHGEGEHADDHGDSGHGDAHGDGGHGGASHGKEAAGHGAKADAGHAKPAAHGAAKSGGHGAAKPSAHGAAKSGGHGAKPAAHGAKKADAHGAKKAKSSGH